MDKKKRAKIVYDYLKEEGYRPEYDPDGDVVFKQEGRTYVIILEERDPEFFRIVFPNFWPIESQEERLMVSIAANEATAKTKAAKVFPIRDNVWASLESFVDPFESFKKVFKRSMSAIWTSVMNFKEKMTELNKS
ncbi:MAG: hypothetical protein Kow0069_25870 [Promethearchaeota archaeon]